MWFFCLSFGGPEKGRFIIGPEKDLDRWVH